MSPLRILPGIMVALLALAGVAAAVGLTLHASHDAALDDKGAAGSHALSASEGGLSASTRLDAGAASLAGDAGVTLPAVPETPGLPAVPTVPSVPAVPAAPAVPSVPQVAAPPMPAMPETPRGEANANGSASATTDHADASGSGALDATLG